MYQSVFQTGLVTHLDHTDGRIKAAKGGRVKKHSFYRAPPPKRRLPANPQTTQSQKAISHFKMLQSRQRGGFWDSPFRPGLPVRLALADEDCKPWKA